LAPEYALGGQLTMKADVYSFGVLILEMVSGRSSSKANWGGMEKFLLEWVRLFPLLQVYIAVSSYSLSSLFIYYLCSLLQ